MDTSLRGKRIELIRTTDRYTKLQPGDRGTIAYTDSLGQISVDWDSGSKLSLIPEEGDQYRILEPEIVARGNKVMGYRGVLLDSDGDDVYECPHHHPETAAARECVKVWRADVIDSGTFI